MKYITFIFIVISSVLSAQTTQDSIEAERLDFIENLKQTIAELDGASIILGDSFSDEELEDVLVEIEANDNIAFFDAHPSVKANDNFAERIQKQREIKAGGKFCTDWADGEVKEFKSFTRFRNGDCNERTDTNNDSFKLEGNYSISGQGFSVKDNVLTITQSDYDFTIKGKVKMIKVSGKYADMIISKK